MFTAEQQADIDTTISIVAYKLGRKYRGWLEREDIRQDLWVWSLSRAKRLAPLVSAETEEQYKQALKFLENDLYRNGDMQCRAQKAKISGYKATDEFFYSQTLIIALLQAHVNHDTMVTEHTSAKVKRSKTLSEGMDIEAMLADLRASLSTMDVEQVALALDLYGREIPSKQLAEQHGVTRQAIEKRAGKVLTKLIEELGGESPYVRR